jgi:hypothetical protein
MNTDERLSAFLLDISARLQLGAIEAHRGAWQADSIVDRGGLEDICTCQNRCTR